MPLVTVNVTQQIIDDAQRPNCPVRLVLCCMFPFVDIGVAVRKRDLVTFKRDGVKIEASMYWEGCVLTYHWDIKRPIFPISFRLLIHHRPAWHEDYDAYKKVKYMLEAMGVS